MRATASILILLAAAPGTPSLAGGDLLVIERSFNLFDGVAIRLQCIAAATIRAGATLRGTTPAVLRPPQRALLLVFALEE